MATEAALNPAVAKLNQVRSEIGKVIVGQQTVVDGVLICLLAAGHVLLEGVPGLGKTTLLRTLARALNLRYSRIQFTPDLMPADIVGSMIMESDDRGHKMFRFQPGPIFAHLVLADEINRATPKTQSALLEAMEERQITVDGITRPLPDPFIVLATQNPIEYEGTFPLPEAQLDRFLIRLQLGYPDRLHEIEMLERQQQRHPLDTLEQVVDASELIEAQGAVKQVYVDRLVLEYIIAIVESTRRHDDVYLGASPRGSLALYRCAQAHAAIDGRDYVIPDDVKALAEVCLAHRIILRPSARIKNTETGALIAEILRRVPVPGVRAGSPRSGR
jgi:MoxR-like ATPase